jgi:hypothetical protein
MLALADGMDAKLNAGRAIPRSNAVAGNAFRPLDIFAVQGADRRDRRNTDAEGGWYG